MPITMRNAVRAVKNRVPTAVRIANRMTFSMHIAVRLAKIAGAIRQPSVYTDCCRSAPEMDRECPDSRLPGERQSDSFPPGERHSDSCPHAECMTDRFSPNAPYSETYYGSLYVLESFER